MAELLFFSPLVRTGRSDITIHAKKSLFILNYGINAVFNIDVRMIDNLIKKFGLY